MIVTFHVNDGTEECVTLNEEEAQLVISGLAGIVYDYDGVPNDRARDAVKKSRKLLRKLNTEI